MNPCPCCDYLTIEELGEHEICPICKWHDEGLNPDNPCDLDKMAGANSSTLRIARRKFKKSSVEIVPIANDRVLRAYGESDSPTKPCPVCHTINRYGNCDLKMCKVCEWISDSSAEASDLPSEFNQLKKLSEAISIYWKSPINICPCCDFKTIHRLCMNEICPVCRWEDDCLNPENFNHLDRGENGPNGMTLRQGRQEFANLVAAKGLPPEAAEYGRDPRQIPL